MINIIPANQRAFRDYGWLKTYWLFSFSDYNDSDNMQFGPLRVFNDDLIFPDSGFPTHPHREMEIITIVNHGEITHEDSTGHKGVIKAREIQRMRAGPGLLSSEFNLSKENLQLFQIWILPDEEGLKPSYEEKSLFEFSFTNKLTPVASGQGKKDTLFFHTDATIYLSELSRNHELDYEAEDSRKIFIYVQYGKIEVNGEELSSKYQARISNEKELVIQGLEDSGFILIDLPE